MIAKEMDISHESAAYYIQKYMNRHVDLQYDETGEPKITYNVEMKSAEEIINYVPTTEYDKKMEEKLNNEIF